MSIRRGGFFRGQAPGQGRIDWQRTALASSAEVDRLKKQLVKAALALKNLTAVRRELVRTVGAMVRQQGDEVTLTAAEIVAAPEAMQIKRDAITGAMTWNTDPAKIAAMIKAAKAKAEKKDPGDNPPPAIDTSGKMP